MELGGVHFAVLISLLLSLATAVPDQDNRITLERAEVLERAAHGLQECRTQQDCPPTYCCTIGMTRYSIPTCTRYGRAADPCRPSSNGPTNYSLSYPSPRNQVEVQSAYLLLCPCDTNFYCHRDTNTCQAGSSKEMSANGLDM